MTRKNLDAAVEWAAQEGWNPGLYDADCFYQTDPQGFFMGFLDIQPIACISAVSYGPNFGFLGFYITKKEFRNQGYGIQVWNKAIDYLKTQNIGLDGVIEQQENYKKSGFKLAYNNARYQFNSQKFNQIDPKVVLVNKIPFDQLNQYDNQFFPVDRKTFLSCWIKQPESTALAYVANNQIQGYGMIRKCRTDYKIGPLFADSFEIADNLFQPLVSRVEENSPVFLDIPEINPDAVKLTGQYQMQKVFSTARMYTKEFPKLPTDKIYGVTTFEVG
ncbi:MAG: GNAT family N-acetyltransferase [Patescibacteria group bacterium]|nr:GNAT family N-acetyltransferase [Patescibacteria group bacterium]